VSSTEEGEHKRGRKARDVTDLKALEDEGNRNPEGFSTSGLRPQLQLPLKNRGETYRRRLKKARELFENSARGMLDRLAIMNASTVYPRVSVRERMVVNEDE
jgi:hypothetical protein